MRLALTNSGPSEALPGLTGKCPSCKEDVIAKCGRINVWHWAHRAKDCDPWAEPESEWHLDWKRRFAVHARTEVTITQYGEIHRADIVLPNDAVLELQASKLSASEISAREQFYGRMAWLYRVTWKDRLHFGQHGFWWKSGSRSMATITKPLFWDFGDHIARVELTAHQRTNVFEYEDDDGQIKRFETPIGVRVLGKITRRWSHEAFIAACAPSGATS